MLRRGWRELVLFSDGATGATGEATGLGAVVRRPDGEIVAWATRRMGRMTNNEAEYAALLLGLEAARRFRPQKLRCFLDSEIVVGQMRGDSSVHSPGLRKWHTRACVAARSFPRVTFTHVPRERNRLADALANEALSGVAGCNGETEDRR